MKFGIREICDVVLKAKAKQTIGSRTFYKNEPVIYFDTLKTSSLEGAATTVYAQGGRGNARLVAWEGERTLTFTMEDALISPAGFMILSGAGLVEATDTKKINVHATETTDKVTFNSESSPNSLSVYLSEEPYYNGKDDSIYVMLLKGGDWNSEPFIGSYDADDGKYYKNTSGEWTAVGSNSVAKEDIFYKVTVSTIESKTDGRAEEYNATSLADELAKVDFRPGESAVFVDYYVARGAGTQQIEITADKFGGNYYLEASTLFRDQNGVDMPAEFIIPNCKIQSNFTFSMASSGDPSTFTFTMDAFPDYTRFDKTKKVLAAIQVINTSEEDEEEIRISTNA